jgi:hypothetical protein
MSGENDVAYPVTYYGDTTDAKAASPIVLVEGATAQIQVSVRAAPNIHVPIPGDRFGSGISSPQLYVRGPGGMRVGVATLILPAGDNRTELSGIPAGRYLVQLQPMSMGRTTAPTLQEIDFADGVPLLIPNSANTIKVSGQMIFEGGVRPASEFQVVLVDRANGFGTAGQVGVDGAIKFTDLTFAPGLYSVQLGSSDFYVRSVAVKGARKVGEQIELVEASSAVITIVATPVESLSKLDGFALRDGKPVAGAMLLLVPKDLNSTSLFRRDQSDSDGSFSMAAIPAGRYTLIGIDDDGRGLVYKDPAVIQPYLAEGQTLEFPLRSKEPVKVAVHPRLP